MKRSVTILVRVLVLACLHVQLGFASSDERQTDKPEVSAVDEERFDVWEFRVVGNTVLPARAVERAVYEHLGPGRSLADVEAARSALEAAYRDAGYGTTFVDIPEQDTAEGVVRLNVTEGRLGRVRVTGSRYYANRRILESLPSVRRGEPPNLRDVQSELASLNSAARNRTVVPVLRAGSAPGSVDLELKVEDSLPLNGALEVNDRYSAGTSRLRLNASLSYDNMFQRDGSLGLQYQVAPEDRDNLEAFVASYVFRTDLVPSTTFAVYGVRSDTDVAALSGLSVLGQGTIIGLRAIRSLPPGSQYSHNVAFGVDYKDFVEDVLLSAEEGVQTPVSYINWSLGYTVNRRAGESSLDASATLNAGLRGVANGTQEFADKRYLGRPNYFYLRTSLDYTRPIVPRLSLFARAAAQYSPDPLISNEQLALGGADTVRGYPESTALGDYGVFGGLEARTGWVLPGSAAVSGSAFLFVDGGVARLNEPLPGQEAETSLASWGAGLRFSVLRHADFGLDWARALRSNGAVEDGDDRTHFSVRYTF